MFERLKKLLFKKNTMSQEEISVDSLNQKFKNHDFQWIKGENLMNTVAFSHASHDGSDFFLNFKGGGRINYNLLEDYMTWFPSAGIASLVPMEVHETGNKPQIAQASITSIQYAEESGRKVTASESPIYSLLSRQKKNPVEIQLKIKVPLPSKDLFNVLISSFDDAEQEIIQFIVDSIDIEDITKTLSKSIRENYYGINTGEKKSPKKQQAEENEQ
jgi:hypothetical protein